MNKVKKALMLLGNGMYISIKLSYLLDDASVRFRKYEHKMLWPLTIMQFLLMVILFEIFQQQKIPYKTKRKLDGVAPLITDPPLTGSTTL